jgi:hypothetical protein
LVICTFFKLKPSPIAQRHARWRRYPYPYLQEF